VNRRVLGYLFLGIVLFVGIFHSFIYIIDFSKFIDAKFNKSSDYEIRKEKYIESAKKSYEWGRVWGEDAAKSFESGIDNYTYSKDMSKEEVYNIANRIYDNRDIDFVCFGPDDGDCGDLPTVDEIKKNYSVNFGSENMPVNAFKSGYIDAFIEFFF